MHLPLALADAPFTSKQASELGLTPHHLTAMVADRCLTRMLRGVYVDARHPDTLALRIAAVGLVLPTYAVVCDRTAAWIHGVDALDAHELVLPPRVDVIVLRDFTRRRSGVATARVRDLEARDILRIDGVQMTTPLRTALDLGCQLHPRTALATLDQFARRHGIDAADLTAELPRFRGRRGVVQLRLLAPLVDRRSESPGESWARMTILEAGLPVPELQYDVEVGDGRWFRLDLAYPALLICIEYDGVEFHTSPADRRADEQRRAWLRARGWIVIVVDRTSWRPGAGARWVDDLAAAVADRRRPQHLRRFVHAQAPTY